MKEIIMLLVFLLLLIVVTIGVKSNKMFAPLSNQEIIDSAIDCDRKNKKIVYLYDKDFNVYDVKCEEKDGQKKM